MCSGLQRNVAQAAAYIDSVADEDTEQQLVEGELSSVCALDDNLLVDLTCAAKSTFRKLRASATFRAIVTERVLAAVRVRADRAWQATRDDVRVWADKFIEQDAGGGDALGFTYGDGSEAIRVDLIGMSPSPAELRGGQVSTRCSRRRMRRRSP